MRCMINFQSLRQVRNDPVTADTTTILHVPAMDAHRARAVSAFPQLPFLRLAPATNAAADGLSISQSFVPPFSFFEREQWSSGTIATHAAEGVGIPTVGTYRISAARA